MKAALALKGQTPAEIVIDIIADVNRVDPAQPLRARCFVGL
jgi:hypothetical protein